MQFKSSFDFEAWTLMYFSLNNNEIIGLWVILTISAFCSWSMTIAVSIRFITRKKTRQDNVKIYKMIYSNISVKLLFCNVNW